MTDSIRNASTRISTVSGLRFKYVVSAVAAVLSAHAHAGTTAASGTASSIFLTINDTTTGAGYIFDTGLPVTSFTGTSDESYNVPALSGGAYSQFMSSVSSGDNLEYAVLGGEEPSYATAPVTLDVTGASAPLLKTYAGIAVSWQQISNLLSTINNPAGSDSYQSATAASGWYAAGYESNLGSALHATDYNSLGSPLSFYQLTAAGLTGHTNGTLTTLAGTWDFSNGLLTYNVGTSSGGTSSGGTSSGGTSSGGTSSGGGSSGGTSSGGGSPVPLPAPAILLLSGLGFSGLFTRRRRTLAAKG